MKTRLSETLLLGFVVLVVAGCHKLEATTKVESNGSGELRMGVGFSPEERANLEKQNPNQRDFCNVSQTQPNVVVTEEQRGDETWCITVTQFKDLDELRGLYGQRKGIKINRLEISGGKFYYDVDLDTSSAESNFSALTDIRWSIVLPGALIDHNADEVDGNALTWVSTHQSGIVSLRAESEAPRSILNFLLWSAGFLGVGVTLIQLIRRRRNSRLP